VPDESGVTDRLKPVFRHWSSLLFSFLFVQFNEPRIVLKATQQLGYARQSVSLNDSSVRLMHFANSLLPMGLKTQTPRFSTARGQGMIKLLTAIYDICPNSR